MIHAPWLKELQNNAFKALRLTLPERPPRLEAAGRWSGGWRLDPADRSTAGRGWGEDEFDDKFINIVSQCASDAIHERSVLEQYCVL